MGDADATGARAAAAAAVAASAENNRFIFLSLDNDMYSTKSLIGPLETAVTHDNTC